MVKILFFLALLPLATAYGKQHARIQTGLASWYEIKCNYGTHTASGETLNDEAMTAAHKTLPLGSIVRVVNLSNNRSVLVRINDRGPYTKGRIIDLNRVAAREIGFESRGITKVRVEVVKIGNNYRYFPKHKR